MRTKMRDYRNLIFAFGAVAFSASAVHAQQNDEGAQLPEGGYFASMVGYVVSDSSNKLDDGGRGSALIGIRHRDYSIELGGVYEDLDGTEGIVGFALNGLIHPLDSLRELFGSVGVGALQYERYPGEPDKKYYRTVTLSAGLGYNLPLRIGGYTFALRSEANYRRGWRNREQRDSGLPLDIPRHFDDVVLNIGLQLPL